MENSSVKILVLTGGEEYLINIANELANNGFNVFKADNQVEAIEKAENLIPNIIFLDVITQKIDGMEFCFEIKPKVWRKNFLLIFLTHRDESFTKIACFDAGADDLIPLPVKTMLLEKKIKSLMRLQQSAKENKKIVPKKEIVINKKNYEVIKKGEKVNIPKKEFEILLLLSSSPERVFSIQEIYNKIWGNEVIVNPKSIPVYIKKLRNKIGETHIVTIKGVGYKFCY